MSRIGGTVRFLAYLDPGSGGGVPNALIVAAIVIPLVVLAVVVTRRRHPSIEPRAGDGPGASPATLTFWKVVGAIVLGGWLLHALIDASQH